MALSAQIQIQDTRYIYVSITHQRICVCIIWVSSTIATLSAICLLNADTTGGAGGGAEGGAAGRRHLLHLSINCDGFKRTLIAAATRSGKLQQAKPETRLPTGEGKGKGMGGESARQQLFKVLTVVIRRKINRTANRIATHMAHTPCSLSIPLVLRYIGYMRQGSSCSCLWANLYAF